MKWQKDFSDFSSQFSISSPSCSFILILCLFSKCLSTIHREIWLTVSRRLLDSSMMRFSSVIFSASTDGNPPTDASCMMLRILPSMTASGFTRAAWSLRTISKWGERTCGEDWWRYALVSVRSAFSEAAMMQMEMLPRTASKRKGSNSLLSCTKKCRCSQKESVSTIFVNLLIPLLLCGVTVVRRGSLMTLLPETSFPSRSRQLWWLRFLRCYSKVSSCSSMRLISSYFLSPMTITSICSVII